ncbi:MAG: cell division protein FtsW [Lachnospiraceae bacterium]|nr:cell division protein FtsW [Lachnospiraceae bacterium]MBD5540277.1 cell division protein FtsW [Lachnospiraceae bacterium]
MANRRKKQGQSEYFFDYSLLFIVLFLLGFGLVMLYSTSSYEAAQDYGSSTFYLEKQLKATILGLAAMMVVANIPYHFWAKFYGLGYVVSVVLLGLIIPFGHESGGAKRWFRIGGLSIQPSEIAKLCMILFLAVMICKMGRSIRSWKGFIAVMLMPLPVVVMVWKITSNLSSAIIIMGIAVLMVFVASPDYKKFILMGVVGAAGVALVVFLIVNAASADGLNYRGERVLAWLDPEAYVSDTGYQTLQALYAIGSGGIWGKGLGQSMQKLGFIPEAQNDMIFSIICEELGLFGAVAIILMFVMLIWRLMVIANNAPDLFGALLVVGVMGHMAIQVILNIAVVTNTIPNTGISLPFISYGGTAVLFQLAEIGLVLNVAKRIQLKEV